MSCTLAYECVDPRCENLTNCLQGVNSLTNTNVWVNTIVEIFTPSLFLYCFCNLTIKGWLSQSLIFYKINKEYTICLKEGAFKIVEVTHSLCLWWNCYMLYYVYTSMTNCFVSLSKNINPSLVLVQPRKTHPFVTERLLMGRKESNQTNKQTSMTSSNSHLFQLLHSTFNILITANSNIWIYKGQELFSSILNIYGILR